MQIANVEVKTCSCSCHTAGCMMERAALLKVTLPIQLHVVCSIYCLWNCIAFIMLSDFVEDLYLY